MNKCQKCGKKTSNTKLCTHCKRGYKFKNNCIGCGTECSGLRCRNCNRLFMVGRTAVKAVGQCDDCGKTISEAAKRCRACANKACKQGKPMEGRHNGGWHRSSKVNRCPGCGARIDTKRCYGCEIREKKQHEMEMRRHTRGQENAIQGLPESPRHQPESIETTRRKSSQVRSFLHHPDVIQSAD